MTDTAAVTCNRCGDRITTRQGDTARCGCGHTGIRWDNHAGCLGPTRIHYPHTPLPQPHPAMTDDCISKAARRLLDLMDNGEPDPADNHDRPFTDTIYTQQATSEADGHRRRTEALWRAWGWLTT